MVILDAYALVAFLNDEPAADEVEALIHDGDAAIGVVNLAEAVDVAGRVHGVPEADIRAAIEPLVGARSLSILVPSTTTVWRAAGLRAAFYARRRRELSLADCFLIAGAGAGDRIATADPPVADVVRQLGLALVALPDTDGIRP
jgi:PIN domain nuclease of toxin-antitoxin system